MRSRVEMGSNLKESRYKKCIIIGGSVQSVLLVNSSLDLNHARDDKFLICHPSYCDKYV